MTDQSVSVMDREIAKVSLKAGIPIKSFARSGKLSTELMHLRRKAIKAIHETGFGAQDIASHFGLSLNTVQNTLLNTPVSKLYTQEEDDQILEGREDGLSFEEIAERLTNRTAKSVFRRFRHLEGETSFPKPSYEGSCQAMMDMAFIENEKMNENMK